MDNVIYFSDHARSVVEERSKEKKRLSKEEIMQMKRFISQMVDYLRLTFGSSDTLQKLYRLHPRTKWSEEELRLLSTIFNQIIEELSILMHSRQSKYFDSAY